MVRIVLPVNELQSPCHTASILLLLDQPPGLLADLLLNRTQCLTKESIFRFKKDKTPPSRYRPLCIAHPHSFFYSHTAPSFACMPPVNSFGSSPFPVLQNFWPYIVYLLMTQNTYLVINDAILFPNRQLTLYILFYIIIEKNINQRRHPI